MRKDDVPALTRPPTLIVVTWALLLVIFTYLMYERRDTWVEECVEAGGDVRACTCALSPGRACSKARDLVVPRNGN